MLAKNVIKNSFIKQRKKENLPKFLREADGNYEVGGSDQSSYDSIVFNWGIFKNMYLGILIYFYVGKSNKLYCAN